MMEGWLDGSHLTCLMWDDVICVFEIGSGRKKNQKEEKYAHDSLLGIKTQNVFTR